MKMRLTSVLLAVVMVLTVVTGCQSKQASSGNPNSSNNVSVGSSGTKKTVLKYWYPWGGDSEKWDKWRMSEFEKAYPDIEIQSTYVPPHAGVDNGKLMAAVQSGNVPDLVVTDSMSQAYSLATQGACAPLDDALKAVGFDASKVNQAELPLMKWKGTTYLYPQNTDTTLLFYRTDYFQQAGLDINHPPKTIAELDADAQKLTQKDASGKVTRYGFIPWLDAGNNPSTWSWQFGASVYDTANNKITIANSKMAAVYEWERTYSQKYGAENMKSFTSSLGAAFSPNHAFMTGKVAMTVIGNWFCNAMKLYAPNIKYKVAPIPAISIDRYGGCALAGNVFFCPKGAKEVKAALQYCQFCQSSKMVDANNKSWRSLGIYKDSIPGLTLYKENDPYLKVCIDVTFNKNSGQWGLCPIGTELTDKLTAMSDKAVYTNSNIMGALSDLQTSLQTDLDAQSTK